MTIKAEELPEDKELLPPGWRLAPPIYQMQPNDQPFFRYWGPKEGDCVVVYGGNVESAKENARKFMKSPPEELIEELGGALKAFMSSDCARYFDCYYNKDGDAMDEYWDISKKAQVVLSKLDAWKGRGG